MKRDPTVVLAYLGEGATSAEDFHTGVNFRRGLQGAGGVRLREQPVGGFHARDRAVGVETFAVKALAVRAPGCARRRKRRVCFVRRGPRGRSTARAGAKDRP